VFLFPATFPGLAFGATGVVFVAGAWVFLRAVITASLAEYRLVHHLIQL
jgi:hypothetical protein